MLAASRLALRGARPLLAQQQRGMATNQGMRDNRTFQIVAAVAVVGVPTAIYLSTYKKTPAKPLAKPAAPAAVAVSAPAAAPIAPAPAAAAAVEVPATPAPAAAPAPAPVPVNLVPMHIKYVLVGAGPASFSAMRTIMRSDPDGQILIVGEEKYTPYMRPPLSKELWFSEDPNVADTLQFTDWTGHGKNLLYAADDFYHILKEGEVPEANDTTKPFILLGNKATKLDPETQTLVLSNGQIVTYDKLLLATGGIPKELPSMKKLSPELKKHVTTYRKVDDFKELDKIANSSETIAIVGGGFLGSELACALARRTQTASKLHVTQIFPEEGNMGLVFPKYLSNWTTAKLRQEGVEVLAKTGVRSFHVVKNATTGKTQVLLKLDNDTEKIVDHVVVSVGLDPNVELAKSAGLEIDEVRGGVVANAELEARTNVFVAGDVSSYHDVALGRRRVEHYDHAVISGRAAGENMAGLKRVFGHQSMFWSDLGPNVAYEAVGITDSSLKTVSVWAVATPKDTPKQATADQPDNIRSGNIDTLKEASGAEAAAPSAAADAGTTDPTPAATPTTAPVAAKKEEYGKGVVFYLKDNKVVGVLMWNLFNKVPVARKIIKEGKTFEDFAELKKLFKLS